MDLFQNATDDQIALMGCFAALAVSAGLMYVSAYLNRARRTMPAHDWSHRTLTLGGNTDRATAKVESPRKVA